VHASLMARTPEPLLIQGFPFSGATFRPILAGALALSVWLAGSAPAAAREPDNWFTRDKAEHYSVSLMLGANGYAAMTAFSDRPAIRAAFGASFSLSAGIAKELFDESIGRQMSWRDLTWDALGTATGTIVAWLVHRYLYMSPRRHP
jgi:putative lipoprotein